MSNLELVLDKLDSRDIEGAVDIINSQKPKKISKYINIDKYYEETIKNLKDKKLFFSQITKFNDKNEYQNSIYQIETKKDEIISKDIEKKQFRDLVCCFTQRIEDDIVMWTRYAHMSSGIKLVFEIIDNRNINNVYYYDKKIEIKKIKKSNDIDNEINKIRNDLNTCIKLSQWEYEKECRVIIKRENLNEFMMDKNIKYENIGIKLTEIVIGSKCKYKKEIQDIAEIQNIKISYEKENIKLEDNDLYLWEKYTETFNLKNNEDKLYYKTILNSF